MQQQKFVSALCRWEKSGKYVGNWLSYLKYLSFSARCTIRRVMFAIMVENQRCCSSYFESHSFARGQQAFAAITWLGKVLTLNVNSLSWRYFALRLHTLHSYRACGTSRCAYWFQAFRKQSWQRGSDAINLREVQKYIDRNELGHTFFFKTIKMSRKPIVMAFLWTSDPELIIVSNN